eukprot:TRINITY_DN17073_c0_g1_i1.p1 TRINITY_DN17073_c0_g1~~TRINITY_DN17073_c0_g1_i1.p1  ORF type:complete len:182 (+),score=8.89 TRINITY_DN17073_c0_g1_i1:82-546(+)
MDAIRLLYLGGQWSASSKTFFQKHNIGGVVNCCARLPCRFPSIARYKVIDVFETKTSDISGHFASSATFIDEVVGSGKAVLVHCLVGASRSVSIVLAYLVAHRGMALRDAWRHVKERRPQARPNNDFCRQLVQYESQVLRGLLIVAANRLNPFF